MADGRTVEYRTPVEVRPSGSGRRARGVPCPIPAR